MTAVGGIPRGLSAASPAWNRTGSALYPYALLPCVAVSVHLSVVPLRLLTTPRLEAQDRPRSAVHFAGTQLSGFVPVSSTLARNRTSPTPWALLPLGTTPAIAFVASRGASPRIVGEAQIRTARRVGY